MTTINFILADGSQHSVDAEDGEVVMRVALREGYAGILAECGGHAVARLVMCILTRRGSISCRRKKSWKPRCWTFAEGVDDNSRLSCQIKISPALDGLIVHVPESQY